jgi:1-aminocyclopropane-1-carboxylate deaminase
MYTLQPENIITETIRLPLYAPEQIEADVLRLDKIDDLISGNKWFKLRFHLEAFKKNESGILVTYGGAWSNHLLATAAACKLYNIRCIGIVRGEKPASLSPILILCENLGMKLEFISRADFKHKNFPGLYKDARFYHIAEGGADEKGMEGASTIHNLFAKINYTHICCAAGTGTTAAGLLKASAVEQVIAVSVLKNHVELEKNIHALSERKTGLTVMHDYSFRGYADHDHNLIDFMNCLYKETSIPTDFVYTGKLFFCINDLIAKNYFSKKSRILIIHSGGLKGNLSLSKGTLIF